MYIYIIIYIYMYIISIILYTSHEYLRVQPIDVNYGDDSTFEKTTGMPCDSKASTC